MTPTQDYEIALLSAYQMWQAGFTWLAALVVICATIVSSYFLYYLSTIRQESVLRKAVASKLHLSGTVSDIQILAALENTLANLELNEAALKEARNRIKRLTQNT